MSTSDVPHARPVEPAVWTGEEDGPGYRDPERWVSAALVAVLVLAFALTDLGPAALATALVFTAVVAVRTRTRRGGARWWTVVEVGVTVLAGVLLLVLTGTARELSAGTLALQLVVGGLVGAGLAVGVAALRGRRTGARPA